VKQERLPIDRVTEKAFAPSGLLAIDPKAFGVVFVLPEPPEPYQAGDSIVVPIRGPLMHHADPFFDSYDAIKSRFSAAVKSKPARVVLAIDSPGGLVSGCFEAVETMKREAAAEGVPVVSYVDGTATSAAYALACVGEEIATPRTGALGSVGVITEVVDVSGLDDAMGAKVAVFTSGARKADGHPSVPLSDDARAAIQKRVDDLAAVFFDTVAAARGKSVDEIRSLEAGVMHGDAAKAAGLADHVVADLEAFLAAPASEQTDAAAAAEGDSPMSLKSAIEALRSAAESEDEEEAKKAKAALKAIEGKAEGDEDEDKPKDDEGKSKAEGDDEDKKDDAKAMAAQALSEIASFKATLASEKEAAERDRLIASRPDLAREFVDVLKASPLEVVKKAVAEWPKQKPLSQVEAARAAIGVQPTTGEGQGKPSTGASPELASQMARVMGLVETKPVVKREGNRLVLGAMEPVKASEGSK
jgi:ClpP class serine protease